MGFHPRDRASDPRRCNACTLSLSHPPDVSTFPVALSYLVFGMAARMPWYSHKIEVTSFILEDRFKMKANVLCLRPLQNHPLRDADDATSSSIGSAAQLSPAEEGAKRSAFLPSFCLCSFVDSRYLCSIQWPGRERLRVFHCSVPCREIGKAP